MTTASKIRETKPKPAELGPRVRGWVLPPDLDLPPAVAQANAAATEAAVEMHRAEAEAAVAAKELRGAAMADQAAARQAVEAGESTVNLTAPLRQKVATESRARAVAAAKVLKARARELRQAIRHDANYVRDREADYNLAAEELAATLEQLPELWHRLLEARATYVPAKRIADEAWCGPVREDVPTEERLRAKVEKATESRRARGGRDLPSFEESVAALAVLLEREAA